MTLPRCCRPGRCDLVIDIATETVLGLREACERLPRGRAGRPTHPTTIARWMDEGIGGIRLECLRVGKARCTSMEALQRFFDRLTARDLAGPTEAPASGAYLLDEDAG